MNTLFELSKKPVKDNVSNFAFDVTDALSAPIVSFPSPWNADIPKEVINNIPIARMCALMQGEQFATIPECVAYIMPACLEFPLNHMWAQIYLHVSTLYVRNFRKQEVPDDIRVEELTDNYHKRLLLDLRRWIYERRRKHLKLRIKTQDKQAKTQVVSAAIIQEKPLQLELF